MARREIKMSLPEIKSFSDIVWDDPNQRAEQALALMLAFRERCGYAPFVGERDFPYVNGMHITDALLDFAEDTQNLREEAVEMIHRDLGYDVWQGWDMDKMIGIIRPNSWQYLWWDLTPYPTKTEDDGDGSFVNPLLVYSNWDDLNMWLLRYYNGYNWEALRSEKYNKVINAKMIGDIRALVNHMQNCVIWPQARSYGTIGTTKYTNDNGIDRNAMWVEMCNHLQSLSLRNFTSSSNRVTIDCIKKGYNESVRFQLYHTGSHKILNVFGYDANIYAHVRFKGDWNFNTNLHKGINYIGRCEAGKTIELFNLDIEELETNPPPEFESIQSGETIELEMAIDWVMFVFYGSFQYADTIVTTVLPLPNKIYDD